jgi:hypothetical protein
VHVSSQEGTGNHAEYGVRCQSLEQCQKAPYLIATIMGYNPMLSLVYFLDMRYFLEQENGQI